MNYQRKQFEEKLEKLKLSESEKNCYRRLNWELMHSRIVCSHSDIVGLAERIKPMVKIDVQERKVVFCSSGRAVTRAIIADAPLSDNFLEYLVSGKAKLEHVKQKLVRLVRFTCYFPSDDKENINLTVETVLQQVPRGVALKQAICFEVQFLSEIATDNYDQVLKCHKANVVLYVPDFGKLNLCRQEERELPSSDDENKKKDKADSQEESTERNRP